MTRAEWEQLGRDLSVGWPFRAWGAELEVVTHERAGYATITLSVPREPERYTGRVEEGGGARWSRAFPLGSVETPEEGARLALELLKEWAAHEAAEALLWRGARPFDPHREEAPPRGRGGP